MKAAVAFSATRLNLSRSFLRRPKTKDNRPIRLIMSSSSSENLCIDSHLHVWADGVESKNYPYKPGGDPPASLASAASTDRLLATMASAGVDGALIVQPINHGFDHSYVAAAIAARPSVFKGMLLHDPSRVAADAVSDLERLLLDGFVGVRFNPYLWPEGARMSDDPAAVAVCRRCADLGLPVGIMCFKGLDLHLEDIEQLIKKSPDTPLILDHLGFTFLDQKGDENFGKLLSLSRHANVHVKISALFRIAKDVSPFPYEDVRQKRFLLLLEKFGASRLMFGTDFPFVIETEGGYGGAADLVRSWATNEGDRKALLGGTAEKLFGKWGGGPKAA